MCNVCNADEANCQFAEYCNFECIYRAAATASRPERRIKKAVRRAHPKQGSRHMYVKRNSRCLAYSTLRKTVYYERVTQTLEFQREGFADNN